MEAGLGTFAGACIVVSAILFLVGDDINDSILFALYAIVLLLWRLG
jgi:hypothetical protein